MKRYSIVFAAILVAVSMPAWAIEGQPGTEPAGAAVAALAAAQQSQIEEPGQLELLLEQLTQARRDGDMDLVKALDAQIPRPEASADDESGGIGVARISRSYGGLGNPNTGANIPKAVDLGTDVKVSIPSSPNIEEFPDMASASNNDLYVVWQDDYLANDYVQVYKSTDGGATFQAFGYVSQTGADLIEPTIAIGEGITGDLVLIAYIVDDGVNSRYVEVATAPLGGGAFTVHPVTGPAATNWDFYKPVIYTDSHSWSGWYAYLTAGAIIADTATNHNVTTWRATDGMTYDTPNFVWGNTDAETWRDPHGTFGGPANNSYIVCFNDTQDTLFAKVSTDFGSTYGAEILVNNMGAAGTLPISHAVDPEIAASIDTNSVMLVCTRSFNGFDKIGQGYSTDEGATWSTLWVLEGNDPTQNEFAPAITANEGGHKWFVAWTTQDWRVMKNERPQDLSDFWGPTALRLNDTNDASAGRTKKGIAASWTEHILTNDPWVGVVWSDFRASPDYQIYYDDDFFIIVIIFIFIDGFESGDTSAWSSTVP
jgi:hypothetical protein